MSSCRLIPSPWHLLLLLLLLLQAGVSENIAWSYATLRDAVDAWYSTARQYSYTSPGYTPAAGPFTQMVWRNAKAVGCAISSAAACTQTSYVCR